jgi:rhodanese-related sulfurtransferase
MRALLGLAAILAVGAVVVHENRNDQVTATQLAAWMHDGRPGLRIIDLRSDSAYTAGHIPGAEHMSLSQLRHAEFRRNETVVLYTTDGKRVSGVGHVYWLHGGAGAWADRHPWRGGC